MALKNKYLFELTYDDLLVVDGENLFEGKAIISVSSPEKKLYIFTINDGVDLETEIFKPFTKLQKTTCSCTYHQNHKVCKHVIAGLYYLREIISQKNIDKPVEKSPKNKTLNAQTILQNLSRGELIQFVDQYTKTDPKFLLQLKVQFARKIDLADNKEKYKSLLDSLIKPYTGKRKPGFSEIKAFLSVSEDFIGQIHDSLALQQYSEAFYMLEAGFSKFEYVRHYYGMTSQQFTAQSLKWHEVARAFFKEKIPYDLKKKLITFLKGLSFTSYYRFSDIMHNVVRILGESGDPKTKKSIASFLIENAPGKQEEEKAKMMALACYLKGSYSAGIQNIVEAPGFPFLIFVQNVKSLGRENIAIETIKNKLKKSGFDRELYILLYNLSIHQNQFSDIVDYVVTLYLRTGEIKYITNFKDKISSDTWHQLYYSQIEKKLLFDPSLKPTFILTFYQMEKKWDEQVHFLHLHQDIQLLNSVAQDLYKNRKRDFEILYSTEIIRHLENHLGDVSYAYLESQFRILDSYRLFSLKTYVKERIIAKYKEREGLVKFLKTNI